MLVDLDVLRIVVGIVVVSLLLLLCCFCLLIFIASLAYRAFKCASVRQR